MSRELQAIARGIVGELLADHRRANLFQRAGVPVGTVASILVDERGITDAGERKRMRAAVVRVLNRSGLFVSVPEQIEPLVPGSAEWLRTITASKVATILGLSPFDSPRSLWDVMSGRRPAHAGNAAMGAGSDLEAGILDNYFRRHPDLRRVGREVTIGRPELPWAAANPDDIAITPDGERIPVQAKYAAGNGDEWGKPGDDDAIPAYYYVQSLWEQHIGRFPRGVLTVLLPRRGPTDYDVHYDPELAAEIESECLAFWESLAGEEPPELDDSVATLESVRAVHPEIEPGTVAQLTPEEARGFLVANHHHDRYTARRRLAHARIYEAMGTAQYGECNGVRVARRQPAAGGKVALYRAGKVTAHDIPETQREDENA